MASIYFDINDIQNNTLKILILRRNFSPPQNKIKKDSLHSKKFPEI